MQTKPIYAEPPSRLSNQSLTKKKKKPKKNFRWLLVGLGLGAVAAASATAGAILAVSLSTTPLLQSQLSADQAAAFNQETTVSYQSLKLPTLSRPVNLLILGTKVLTSETDPSFSDELGYHALVNSFDGLTDTMLLLRFEPTQKKLVTLSIPRDTQAEIEGYGLRKINEANYYGGPALAAESVSDLLEGVPIDRYVRINVQGIEKLIDALGGVEIYVPRDMKYTDHSQHLYIDLKEGHQRLTGEKAVQFLRFRYDRYGDIGRVQRQQSLIRAVVEQTLKPQTLLQLPKVLSVIQSHVDTNLTVEELLALAGLASRTERSNVQMLMLPGRFSGNGRDGVSYWLPSDNAIEKMTVQYLGHGYQDYNDGLSRPLRIAIQDSINDPDAVQAAVSFLRDAGYRNVYVASDWSEPLKTTRLIAQKGDGISADELRIALGIGEVLVESTGNLSSDITIQLGRDWQQAILRN